MVFKRNEDYLDLGVNNFMKRKDGQFVIIDPFYGELSIHLGEAEELSELQKPKEIGQIRSYMDQNNPYFINSKLETKISDFMERYQFSQAGTGLYAAVYTSPKYPFALKLFQRDSGYLTWLDFCRKNQNNSLVPKIRGNIVKIHKFMYAIRIEKLLPVEDDDLAMFDFDEYDIEAERLFKEKILYSDDPLDRVEPTGNDDFDSILELFQKNEGQLDLHKGNFMKRKNDTLVIIDPFSGKSLEESQQINEKHYRGPLYHSTIIDAAVKILDTEVLKMSSTAHEVRVNKAAPKGYEYWLSVSRDKNNSYKKNRQVTFLLDTDYLDKSNAYVIKPVEYFGSGKKYRTEAEERIFGRKNYIDTDVIVETHVDCNVLWNDFFDMVNQNMAFLHWDAPKKKIREEMEDMFNDISNHVFKKLELINEKSRICYMYLTLGSKDYKLLNKKNATTNINDIKKEIMDYMKNHALRRFNDIYTKNIKDSSEIFRQLGI